MKTDKRQFGDFGEGIACQFLMKQGFSIVERNYLKPWGEIDIIAKKRCVYHFVEVKSVARETLDSVIHETEGYRPEDNIHQAKLKRISRAVQTYCLERNISNEWKFDVAVVYIEKSLKKVRVQMLFDIVL